METIGERLEHFKKQNGLTYKDLGDVLGITSDAIRVAINRNKIKDFYINIISEKLKISKDWLLTGDGEMILAQVEKNTVDGQEYSDQIEKYAAELEIMKEKLELKNKIIEGLEFKVETLEERIARIKAANNVD